MTNNKYIIKSLAPWMMDELLALSKITNFEVVFLRKQKKFYQQGIQKLQSNDINVLIEPFSWDRFLKKVSIVIRFFFLNIKKFGFDYNSAIGFKSMFWFLKLDLSKFPPDSNIHAQFATQPALIALLIKKYYNNTPCFTFTFHAHDIYFDNKWFSLLVKNSIKAFSISSYNIKYVKEKFLKSEKITLSRLGVFRDDANKIIPNDKDKFTLGLISWFTEKKGIFYLLKAMLEIKNTSSLPIKLVLAGDGPLKKEITQYVMQHDLTNSIEYIGKISGSQKKDFFKKLDVFVLPSITLNNDKDGIPVVLMEAISYGLPLITTNISGIPEICKNEFNGYLIKEKNVKEIVASILRLYNNLLDRELFSRNSLIISDEYDIELNSKDKARKMGWF